MRASDLIAQLQIFVDKYGDRIVYDSDNMPIEELAFEQNEIDSESFILFSEGDMH